LAWGVDRRSITPRASVDAPDKSMGNEETFSRDVDDRAVIARELLRLSGKVAQRLRRGEVVGRTVSIKVRFADFSTITRATTLADPTDVTQEIYRSALKLYDALGLQRARIRLVGVRVERLIPRQQAGRQLMLGERERGWSEADHAMDRASLRFGSGAVAPASLFNR
jgi:DNA polymerase IV